MNKRQFLFSITLTFTAVIVAGGFGLLFYYYYDLKKTLDQLSFSGVQSVATGKKQIIEKIVSKSEVWRPVQQQVKDTVVQVFAQIAEIDLLLPFKTPAQYSSTGSAFFINEQGDLLTNAHVVDQAKAIWIQVPSLGKTIIKVDIIGISPDRDVALLRVIPDDLKMIRQELGRIPYLQLGDSDLVFRSDEVLALGYPLGQQSLKSTTGVISGREQQYIQMSAPINPGNSGGPLLNINGEVIGINSAGIVEAQNVGYIIPINDVKIILPDLYKIKLLRKPFLGVLFNNGNPSLTEYLNNPQPGGCYVVEVVKDSTLYKAGVQQGDMIYEINGYRLDVYGEMNVPWSEDKISLIDYVSRLAIGEDVRLVVYRSGQRKEFSVKFSQAELPAIRRIYPGYEIVDYEVYAGMVIMQLTANHIQGMKKNIPGLARFAELKHQKHPVLIVTHVFPTSELFKARSVTIGATVNKVHDVVVHTLQDFRRVIKEHAQDKFLTLSLSDNLTMTTDNLFVVLPMDKIVAEQAQLAHEYHYPLSQTVKDILQARGMHA